MQSGCRTVLIVEDETSIAETIIYALQTEGFTPLWKTTGREALAVMDEQAIALVILDVGLPDVSGFDVCREILRRKDVPVIFLTARSEEMDRVVGFELGADDYVMKPFSPRELVLRVKSMLRRSQPMNDDMLTVGEVRLYPGRRKCVVTNKAVTLSAKEFDLLFQLMRGQGNVITRDFLMDQVWGYNEQTVSRTLDTHIRRLREKLGQAGATVQTVRRIGYRIALTEDE